jgi:type IV pilus assembly protein PilE
MRSSVRGLSLIEVSVGLAVLGVIASMALPSYQSQVAKARRAQAISALNQVQSAQEQHRAQHGAYAQGLRTLSGVATPPEQYELAIVSAHAAGYIARAALKGDMPLNGGCQELTLTVADGAPSYGPSERCWNR